MDLKSFGIKISFFSGLVHASSKASQGPHSPAALSVEMPG